MFIMNRATQNLMKKSKRREQTNMKKLSKTNVNNMKKGAVAVALVASLGLAGLSAYFTDTKNATNTFTVGSVKQTLTEDKWKPEENPGKDMTPGKEVEKNPTIKNVGDNTQYAFMKVEVPAAKVTTVNADGTKAPTKEKKELFTYDINDGWNELVSANSQTDTSVTHVYYYGKNNTLTVLNKDASATLFDKVKFINIVEDNRTLTGPQNIVINSYGIQSDNLGDATTPDQVWKLVQKQTK